MNPAHIDDFYFVTAEVLCQLYAAFPVRNLVLVEDISGPIQWDMTGLPDRKSRACFETIIWLENSGLLTFRSIEPREVGVEGAVLTQPGFVLLTGLVTWTDGESMTRIDALRDARRHRAYDDLGTVMKDLFRANCAWSAPAPAEPLPRAAPLTITDESFTDSA